MELEKENKKENTVIKARILAMQEEMAHRGIDFYFVPTADFHNSEYVGEYFKVREFLSGFTGSNGTLVLSGKQAGLWTDGRYFIQAEKELEGTGIQLYRMQEAGVPTIEEYLAQEMPEGAVLGFDGRVADAAFGKRLEEKLSAKNIAFRYGEDVADAVFGSERPALSCGRLWILPGHLCGEDCNEKLARVREKMAEEGADAFLLSKLDDIMWLYNVRGSDIACNPVAMSYTYITKDDALFFVQEEAMTQETKSYFAKHHITVKPYGALLSYLREIPRTAKVLIDMENCNYLFYKTIQEAGAATVEKANPTTRLKAVKNKTELQNMEEIYLRDSVALTKFIYWLKKNIGRMKITEVSAAAYLDNLRRQTEGFLDLSFPTIAGYKENAAMMHYEATPENCSELALEGMFLVDSGGQYLGGTTDVTRTIVLGKITDEMKEHFTAVACGMLRLTGARFLHGCTGRNLDILARELLWKKNIDYKCGTGHGIGYILNVHEGPQDIRWRLSRQAEAPIEAGMAISNEPGVYIEGSHGIRTENVIVAKNGEKNGDGQFMYFDTLTFVPIDRDGIDAAYMAKEDIDSLNAYHQAVYEKLEGRLDADERAWLKEVTAPVAYNF